MPLRTMITELHLCVERCHFFRLQVEEETDESKIHSFILDLYYLHDVDK